MRAFVAIELSAEVRAACGELIAALRPQAPSVRWVRPENIHLTLRFLGDIDAGIAERVMQGIADRVAVVPPITLKVHGIGVFPNPRKPAVLWAGVQTMGDGLARVQEAAEAAAQAAGLEPERRGFKPHLTIGRMRPPAASIDWGGLVTRYAQFETGAWEVRNVALFASELHPAGARYRLVSTVSLGKPPHDQS